MGQAKKYLMEMEEQNALEDRNEWIREHLGDESADQNTPEWYEAELAYDEYWENHDLDRIIQNDVYSDEDYWSVFGKTNYDIFNDIILSTKKIISLPVQGLVEKNLLVMSYGHIIATVESYLSSTFIDKVFSSPDSKYIKKFVDKDHKFGNKKFSMRDVFVQKEHPEDIIKEHLRTFVFHNIADVSEMYRNVLGVDFNEDVEWLTKAVKLRHHCVHRAGYDKNGNEIDLDRIKVKKLIKKCVDFVRNIELKLQLKEIES